MNSERCNSEHHHLVRGNVTEMRKAFFLRGRGHIGADRLPPAGQGGGGGLDGRKNHISMILLPLLRNFAFVCKTFVMEIRLDELPL